MPNMRYNPLNYGTTTLSEHMLTSRTCCAPRAYCAKSPLMLVARATETRAVTIDDGW